MRKIINFFRDPINHLYVVLSFLVLVFSIEKSNSEEIKSEGHFYGKLNFKGEKEHYLNTEKVIAKITQSGEINSLQITIIDEKTGESIFVDIKNFRGVGTYFCPGDSETENFGSLVKDRNNFRNNENFFETTHPNSEGINNGVGRLNIIKSGDYIEGELILIANNQEGIPAILESSKFKIPVTY